MRASMNQFSKLMRRHTVIIVVAALFIWLALVIASHRIADDIGDILRDDAVALLGLPVQVEQVDVGLASGYARVTGLQIGNLEGFPSSNVFDLADIQLNIGMLSALPALLGGRPYKIEEILIDSPVVYVDAKADGSSNLEQILRSIRQSKSSSPSEEIPESQPGTPTPGSAPSSGSGTAGKTREPVRLKVEQLTIDGLSFHLNREGREAETGTLPTIQMQDIGGDRGITPHALGIKVTGRLAGDIMAVVLANKAAEKMNASMENALKDLEKKLRK